MQRRITLFATLVLVSCGTLTFAQEFTAKSVDLEVTETGGISTIDNEDLALFADEENKVYFIDFENLNVNLSHIVVKKESGEVLMDDDVFDLPVNTIYELDFSDYATGKYELELRSFTGIIRRTLEVK